MNLRCLFLVKIVAIYGLLVCKTFGLKIGSCKFFDKFQVCEYCWENPIHKGNPYLLGNGDPLPSLAAPMNAAKSHLLVHQVHLKPTTNIVS